MIVNGNPAVLYIVGGILAVAIIAASVYHIARAMKGSMKIAMKQNSFRSGEPIEGELTVMTKKAIPVDRMYIALIGERQVRSRSSNGNTSTKWREFYRDEGDIPTDEFLRAGFAETYEFSLEAPSVPTIQGQLSAIAENVDNELVKGIAKGVGQLAAINTALGGGRRRWRLVSRLETKGVDLAASRKIHVSLRDIV